jgi:DNA (cytosine-5)-methyltransferase 1
MDGTSLPHASPARSRRARSTSANRIVAVDLFCGAGGLSYAFQQSGFRIAAAVEKDPHAAESYRTSFVNKWSEDTKLFECDIRDPEVTEGLRAVREAVGAVDIVIGGPPCQDFSPARLKLRRDGTRATLVQQYFAILALLEPRAFLFENVPGLRTAGRGRYWRGLTAAAKKLGYRILHAELEAHKFGVPQRRHRLFVVGLKEELGEFVFPEGTEEAPTVGATIGDQPPLRAGEKTDDPMHCARAHHPDTVEYLAQIKQGQCWRDVKHIRILRCHEKHNGHYDVYGRMKPDEIAPTITGGCTNPSKGRFIHPTQHRGLTVREAALLQTFPRDWEFCGGVEAASQQVGNAVPVKLGEVLARALRTVLESRVRLSSSGS